MQEWIEGGYVESLPQQEYCCNPLSVVIRYDALTDKTKFIVVVPRMSALFFHRPPIYERATDHTYTKGCGHLGKKCGWDQV